ncbi:MAG: ABC transporter ATP-binding protein [Thermoplasmatota archaeon]
MAGLRMRGIAKSYGGRPVLRGIDLDVGATETVAVLGANGAGKSTLLRVAATLARPSDGMLEVAGVDARAEPEQARHGLSILTQEAPLYPELSPREHLAWWARAQAMPDADPDARLIPAGLAAVAHRPARTLSRGQRQRLALAMALLPDRPVLLLDEPFAALDDAGAAWLAAELRARRGRQAVLMALHDPAQAAAVADRVQLLRDGRLEAA